MTPCGNIGIHSPRLLFMMSLKKHTQTLLIISTLSIGNLNTNTAFSATNQTQTSESCESPLRRPLMSLGRQILKTRYQTTVRGSDVFNGPQQGVLVLANHPGFIDPAIMITQLDQFIKVRPLMKENVARHPVTKAVARITRAVLIPDMSEEGRGGVAAAQAAVQSVIDALARGENIILYPSGTIYRQQNEKIGANSAVDRILKALPKTKVVLARSRGIWGSSFSFGLTGESPVKKLLTRTIPRAIMSIVSGGIFFAPKRKVEIDFVEAKDMPRDQGRLAINRYLEKFYNEDAPPAMKVPYFWWQGSTPTVVENKKSTASNDRSALLSSVDPETRRAIYEFITQKLGDAKISDEDLLEAKLGMDSLSRVEMLVWVGETFGREVPEASELKTVGDVLLAAEGKIASTGTVELKPVKANWFYNESPDAKLSVPEGETIPEVFLAQARRHPNRAAVADQISGVLTYRDVVGRIMLLKPLIEELAGDSDRIGIMMPASVSATVLTLAAQFAGKTPVMINFTAGKNGVTEAIKTSGITKIITSQTLLEKLKTSGLEMTELDKYFFKLEGLKDSKSFKLKFIRTKIDSYGPWGLLDSWARKNKKDEAVILFTSGSEKNPKGVPLTHQNQLANIRALAWMVPFTQQDRLMGVLPSFHSFGLTVTQMMSICLGLPTVYFPSPLDGEKISAHINAYEATLVPGTPTFLEGIARAAARDPKLLGTVRMWITGAAKCGNNVYRALGMVCPRSTVIEGYGITETSPAISINPPNKPKPGTLGQVLPGVKHVIVDPETMGKRVDRGSPGLLLVQGKNIFSGYLGSSSENPFVEFEGSRWYNTGDIVKEDADGYLVMSDRMSRFIKVGGEKISLTAIESPLVEMMQSEMASSEDTGPAVAVEGLDETEEGKAAVKVAFSTKPLTVAKANEALRTAGLNGLFFITEVVQVKELPMLGSGKVDYKALRRSLKERR